MPYIIRHKNNLWLTINTEKNQIKGRHKTKKLAVSQMRLLYGIGSGWEPTGGKK